MSRPGAVSVAAIGAAFVLFTANAPALSDPTVPPRSQLLTLTTVGNLAVSENLSLGRAGRHFEQMRRRPRIDLTADGCRLAVESEGLYLNFESFELGQVTAASCNLFMGLTVAGRGWHSPGGLRVGARAVTLHRLYPHAKDFGPAPVREPLKTKSEIWLLKYPPGIGIHPWLAAYVHRGVVVALGILMVGH